MTEATRPESIEELKGIFADLRNTEPVIITEEERLAADAEAVVSELVTARDMLLNYNHGKEENSDSDEAAAALQKIHEMKALLAGAGVPTDSAESKWVSSLTQYLADLESGFEYRKAQHLPGVFQQQDSVRTIMTNLLRDQAAGGQLTAVMAELYRQPDAGFIVDQLKKEYHEIMNLLEEFSENPEDMTLDVRELWSSFFSQNAALDFEGMDRLAVRFRKAKVIEKNIGMITKLAELQGNEHTIDTMKKNIPKLEGSILERAVSILDFRRGVLEQEISSGLGRGIVYEEETEQTEDLSLDEQVRSALDSLVSLYEDEDKKREQLLLRQSELTQLEVEQKALEEKQKGFIRSRLISALTAVKKDAKDPLIDMIEQKSARVQEVSRQVRELEVTLRVLDTWRATVHQLEKDTQQFLVSI